MNLGIHGVQDLTVTVADRGEASDFFTSFFGATVIADDTGAEDGHRSSMRELANGDVRTVIHGSRLLRTPFLNIRLVEASYPGQRALWPGMLDVGGWHLAGYVDDMDEAMAYLETTDVYILGPGKKPTTNGPEVGEGSYACHCMTRWGFHFELLSYPHGRAYMDDFEGRLWNPAEPDRGATLRGPAQPALPGFRGFEHLSVAVGDLDEVSTLLEDACGCERFYDMGPMDDRHGSGFGAYANVDVRVRASRVRLYRTPYLNIELIEAAFPGQNRVWPNLFDVGGWKLSLAVEGIDEALGALVDFDFDVHALGSTRHEGGAGTDGTQKRLSCLAGFGWAFDLTEGGPVQVDGIRGWSPSHPGV